MLFSLITLQALWGDAYVLTRVVCIYISFFFLFSCLFTYKHFACFLREFPCKVQLFLRLRTCPVHNLLALQRVHSSREWLVGPRSYFDFACYCSASGCDGPGLSCGCREQDITFGVQTSSGRSMYWFSVPVFRQTAVC